MIRSPNAFNLVVLIGTLLVMLLGIVGLRRWIASKQVPGTRKIPSMATAAEIR
jgi:hypothetical protein